VKSFEEIYNEIKNEDFLESRDNETLEELIDDFIEECYRVLKFEKIYQDSLLKENKKKQIYESLSNDEVREELSKNIKASTVYIKDTRERIFKQIMERKRTWIDDEYKQKIMDLINFSKEEIKKFTPLRQDMIEYEKQVNLMINLLNTYPLKDKNNSK
jgi:hypothetical protein